MNLPQTKEPILERHQRVLENRIFQIHTKWPEFQPLLESLRGIGTSLKGNEVVIDLGRYYLYDGCCLFAPYFAKAKHYIGADCVLPNWKEVYGYQRWMVEDERLIRVLPKIVTNVACLPLKSEVADWVLIPNIVEHVDEPEAMFRESVRILRKGGRSLVFAPHVREEHQPPFDYFRYTRYGLRHLFEKVGFQVESITPTTGIFDVLSKTAMLALDFLPSGKRRVAGFLFEKLIKPVLWRYDRLYQKNLVTKGKEFPMAYVSLLRKP
jgi:SAM-dependent methyltransferase